MYQTYQLIRSGRIGHVFQNKYGLKQRRTREFNSVITEPQTDYENVSASLLHTVVEKLSEGYEKKFQI
jgi:hypothetical protein